MKNPLSATNRLASVASILLVIAFAGCHSKIDPAFRSATKNVTHIENVIIPGSDALPKAVADAGGYPPTADSATSAKGVDTQFSIGYGKDDHPLAAVVVNKDGTIQTLTDADLLTGYDRKVRALMGKSAASSNGGTDSSGASAATPHSSGGGGNLPGCPVHIGDSRAIVDHKLGHPDLVSQNSDGSTLCTYAPFDGQAFVEANAVGYVSGFLGFGGGLANHEGQQRRHKGKSYAVEFQDGIVSAINLSQ